MIYIKGCWVGMVKTGLGVQLRSSSTKLCFTLFSSFVKDYFVNNVCSLRQKIPVLYLFSIESKYKSEEKFVVISLTWASRQIVSLESSTQKNLLETLNSYELAITNLLTTRKRLDIIIFDVCKLVFDVRNRMLGNISK